MRWTLKVRGLRRLAATSLLPAGFLVPSANPLMAQDLTAPRTGRFESARGTETSNTQQVPPGEPGAVPAPAPISLNRSQRRDLEQARRRAADLADQSAGAFERGLMPFNDYLEQTALVQWTEQLLTDVRYSGNAVSVQRNHVARMQSALDRLRQFGQPNAKHWEADVALAEWAAADAENQLALAERNEVAAGQAAMRRSDAAREHDRLRQRDAEIGWASLQATSLASELAVSSALPGEQGQPQSAADHRAYLAAVARRTADWSQDGAGIGRSDRVQKSELAVDLVDLSAALQDDRPERAKPAMRRAEEHIRDLFATQQEFHGKGTASLYDLSRTWLAWRELHELGTGKPGLVDADQLAERREARTVLSGLADRTLDRQGRNAADVTVVRLLEQMDGLEALRRPAGQPGEYLK